MHGFLAVVLATATMLAGCGGESRPASDARPLHHRVDVGVDRPVGAAHPHAPENAATRLGAAA